MGLFGSAPEWRSMLGRLAHKRGQDKLPLSPPSCPQNSYCQPVLLEHQPIILSALSHSANWHFTSAFMTSRAGTTNILLAVWPIGIGPKSAILCTLT